MVGGKGIWEQNNGGINRKWSRGRCAQKQGGSNNKEWRGQMGTHESDTMVRELIGGVPVPSLSSPEKLREARANVFI